MKVYTKKESSEVRRFNDHLAALKARGIPLPTVIALLILGTKPAVVYEYCPGRHPFDASEATLESIATMMATLHRVDYEGFSDKRTIGREELLMILERCTTMPAQEVLREIVMHVDLSYQKNLPRGIVHGDFSYSNLLVDCHDKLTALLDFDHACYTDLLTDVARAQIFFSFDEFERFCPERCAHFLSAYSIYRPLTEKELEGFRSHLLLHLVRMYAETYYYVDERKEVDRKIFTGHRRAQSPEALFRKIENYCQWLCSTS